MENGRVPQPRYAIDCDHAALVITDCQNDFLSPGESIVNTGAYRADTTNPIESAVARSRERRFEAMIRTYSADLYRLGYWLCHDPVLAEDLMQQTYMRAWNSLDQLRDVKAAKGWLITILRRENARHFQRYQPEEMDLDPDDLEARAPAYDTSIEAVVLRWAIAELPQAYREPLLLQVVGGYSCHEIAERLDIPTGAVFTRLFRARQRLRATLAGGNETTH